MKVYKHSAAIIKQITQRRQGFKTAFYEYCEKNERHIGSQMNKVYSISINVYKRLDDINRAIDQIFSNETIKEREMLMVLIYDGAMQKQKIKIGGKLATMVKTKILELQALLSCENGSSDQSQQQQIVYLRPNKHISQELRLGEIRSQLLEEGFKVRKFGKLQLLRIKEQSNLSIATHALIKEHQFIIQDFSSCMPVIYLKAYLNSLMNEEEMKQLSAIDATSAPGNKSLQLSEFVKEVCSFEMDEKRYQTLKRRAEQCEALNIKAIHHDFLEVDTSQYSNIDIILCDPSCSGSGMKLHNKDQQECTLNIPTPMDQQQRAQSLSRFQFKILTKAMTQFENVKYVVYSTCSIYEEENEQVVRDILKKNGKAWGTVYLKNIDVGIKGSYKEGLHFNEELNCLRICSSCGPQKYLNGFFLTIFERFA